MIEQKKLPDDRLLAAIGYIPPLFLLPLLLNKKSAFSQHHGKQGLVIFLAWLVLWVGNIVPVLGQIVWFLGSLLLSVFVLLGIINALDGKMWKMPFLGRFVKNIKL